MTQLVRVLKDRIQTHAAYVRLFNTPDGKIVLAHLMRQGYVFQSTHVPGDPNTTAMNEGSRRMVLSILKYVHRNHSELIKELEERIQDDIT